MVGDISWLIFLTLYERSSKNIGYSSFYVKILNFGESNYGMKNLIIRLEEEKDYSVIYELSVKLDKLIAEYYKA